MKKLFLYFAIFIISILGIYFSIGIFSNKEFKGEISFEVNSSKEKIWKNLTSIEDLPKARPEILSIDILERDENGFPSKWKENTDMNGYAILKPLINLKEKEFKLEMSESTFGMNGTWHYILDDLGSGKIKITIKEDSKIDNISTRAIMSIMGRDSNLKIEKENILKSVLN